MFCEASSMAKIPRSLADLPDSPKPNKFSQYQFEVKCGTNFATLGLEELFSAS